MDDKRTEKRDPGEVAASFGLTTETVATGVVHPGKCPTCGRDKINT